ncbi:hypothetical protein JCM8097_007837 [Rhodosporidiobolus ruineniae]
MASPSLTALQDALDLLLEDYLDTLTQYQAAREQLNTALKQGHFHLAKAKLALGPARVGERSYDLTEHPAQLVAVVSPASSAATAASEGEEKEGAPALLSYTVEKRLPRPAPPAGEEEKQNALSSLAPSSSSGLRQRLPPSSLSPPSSSPDSDDGSPPKPRPPPPSPLHQFSPLPPPSLRSSASAFEDAVRAASRVVELEGQVRERARGVKRARRAVEVARKAEGATGEE